MNNIKPDPLHCPYCGAPKERNHLACRTCYSRLPQTYKQGFIDARKAAEQWLREHSSGHAIGIAKPQFDREV
jgi:hypothetical protein